MQQSPVLVTVGPGNVDLLVRDHGKRGGYAYSCDTGPTGENWWFKKDNKSSQWNILASVHSTALICTPLEVTMRRLRQILADIGCKVRLESIGRIDFAMDFLAPDFALDHNQFVAHGRTKVRPTGRKRRWTKTNPPPSWPVAALKA